jgi:hypothetical protein
VRDSCISFNGSASKPVGKVRRSCSWDVSIERGGRNAKAVRNLGDADVGIGQQRLGGFSIVVGEFRDALNLDVCFCTAAVLL